MNAQIESLKNVQNQTAFEMLKWVQQNIQNGAFKVIIVKKSLVKSCKKTVQMWIFRPIWSHCRVIQLKQHNPTLKIWPKTTFKVFSRYLLCSLETVNSFAPAWTQGVSSKVVTGEF